METGIPKSMAVVRTWDAPTFHRKLREPSHIVTALFALALLLVMAAAEQASAATIASGTCSRSDVSSAIGRANDGDTVVVPPGTCTWSPTLTIVNKSISLVGAGIGQTIIDGIDGSTYGRGTALDWTLKATGLARLSGFTWRGSAGAQGYAGGTILSFRGYTTNFRFDHNRVEATTTGGIQTWGHVSGVGDHNELVCVSCGQAHLIQATHSNWSGAETSNCGPLTCGDSSWAADNTIGGLDNLYWEDNLIQSQSGPYCTDDFVGARTIYRFNRIENCTLQLHGTETGGRMRGARYHVTYRNRFVWTTTQWPGVVANRGGSGRHWDNVITGGLNTMGDLSTLRSNDDYNASGHAGSYPYGRCGQRTVTSMTRSGSTVTVTFASGGSSGPYSNSGGSYQTFSGANQPEYNGTFLTFPSGDSAITFQVSGSPASPATGTIVMASPFDTPVAGYTGGYRCLDQAGAGKSIMYSGNGPQLPPNISPIASGQSALEPILVWGNTLNGAQADINLQGVPVVQLNRDVYNENDSCAGSSCTGGIGRGTSLPSFCTPTPTNSGPYFFDTDAGTWNSPGVNGTQDTADANGVLYKCSAPNTWTVFYTPFAYPHPVVSGSFGDASPPAAPTGLRVN
jgi:hypothetical protein